MKPPAAFNHNAVVVSENYERIDGRFARRSAAISLSLGLTRRDERGKADVSAKVWGSGGEPWSGPSEELPLHRILDLSLLICRSLAHFREAYKYEHLYDPQRPVIDRIGLQGNAMTVAINTDNVGIHEDLKLFSQALNDNDELIGERLRALSKILKDMGY
ncbi:DUF6530 family protein [Paenibacillus sp. P26]|nr:DUF6530 family protein [Paenibacillus sp. P26]